MPTEIDENRRKKWQDKVLGECPAPYRTAFKRAYAGKSRTAAIRAFCLRCVGYTRADVRDCTSWACPLHPYRPYQTDAEPDEAVANEPPEG